MRHDPDGNPIMPCADEGGRLRSFMAEVYDGEATGDHTCLTCGWMQRSFDQGKIELAWNVLDGTDEKDERAMRENIDTALDLLSMREYEPSEDDPRFDPELAKRLAE